MHDLKRHQKLHTGERPYQCPICQRSFSRLDALNRHRKTEGGSACLKSSNSNNVSHSPTKRMTISPCLPPTLSTCSSSTTSQWQLNSKTLPSPFLSKPTNNNTAITSPTTPLPFILPFNNNALVDDDEMDKLKQRIHDLEIEVKNVLINKKGNCMENSNCFIINF